MRRDLVLGMVVSGAAVGYGASFMQSTLYASTSTLMVVPARVSEAFLPGQGRARTTAVGTAIGLLAGLGIAFRRPRPRG